MNPYVKGFLVGWFIGTTCIVPLVLFLHDTQTYGYYLPISDTLVIDGDLDESYACYVFWHEYGHAVYERLNQTQKDEWERIHQSGGEMTEYAKTNKYEDFAETYAYAHYCDIVIERYPNSSRGTFMRELYHARI